MARINADLAYAARCSWILENGRQCKNPPAKGQPVCSQHLALYRESLIADRVTPISPEWEAEVQQEYDRKSRPAKLSNDETSIRTLLSGITDEEILLIEQAARMLKLDLESQAVVVEALPEALDSFKSALLQVGFAQSRLSQVTLLGLTRLLPGVTKVIETPSGTMPVTISSNGYQYSPEFVHTVTVIDDRIVADPFSAILYPANDVNRSTAEQAAEIGWQCPTALPPYIAYLSEYLKDSTAIPEADRWEADPVRWISFDRMLTQE